MVCRSCIVVVVFAGIAALTWNAVARDDQSKPASPSAPTAEPGADGKTTPAPAPTPTPGPADVLAFTMNRIDGTAEDLNIYRGKVVMVVNVASKCGLTKQYAGLQKLYESKKDSGGGGLVILGFPANDFMGQEPGTNKQIKEFCEGTYKVTFPMFEKIAVTGKEAHPLYKKLAAQPAPIGGEPGWNFTKFIVDRSGNVVARFDSRVKPDDEALVKKIDELLAEKK